MDADLIIRAHSYYFDQLIDHTNPSLGTFKQRYWHTWEFYKPGGCVVLSTPGGCFPPAARLTPVADTPP